MNLLNITSTSKMRRIIFFYILLCCQITLGFAQKGIPFFMNFDSDDYGAHNRNFSILCDNYGRVYVANFEGLLYYDQAKWNKIHTPGISRITVLYKDSQQRIWVGGYNIFGYLNADHNGRLSLQLLSADTDNNHIGGVLKVIEENDKINVYTSSGTIFSVDGQSLVKEGSCSTKTLAETIIYGYYQGHKINHFLNLENGITLLATSGKGVVALNSDKDEVYVLSEANGLCSDNVNYLASDGSGNVWGATDNGLFCLNVSGVYSRFTVTEGLKGEVVSIYAGKEGFYVGTLQGLFYRTASGFVPVNHIRQACWNIVPFAAGKLLAATSEGVFVVKENTVEQLTAEQAFSVHIDQKDGFYIGELDGVYYYSANGKKNQIDSIGYVNDFFEDNGGELWASTMYGEVYRWENTNKRFVLQKTDENLSDETKKDYKKLFKMDGQIYLLNRQGIYCWDKTKQKLSPDTTLVNINNNVYPQIVYPDYAGRLWFTDNQGENLFVVDRHNRAIPEVMQMNPVSSYNVRAICVLPDEIWIGGNFGLIVKNLNIKDEGMEKYPEIFIRKVSFDKDSILYGGFSVKNTLEPQKHINKFDLDNRSNKIQFSYSMDKASVIGKTMYRYRLKKSDEWSSWSELTFIPFLNLSYGNYDFEVMGRDSYGRQTDPVSVSFTIHYPLYLRWYSIIAYIVLLGVSIFLLLRLRTHRLMKEKMRLEAIVDKRTSQIRLQKEEIEEKSKSLEKALNDLSQAQDSLIRQEKMATVGQLTKGLIDRILNPLNYINNFSHLTLDLIKDVEQNLADEKEHIDEEVYEDTEDVLSMINSNLSKIESHGVNVTRILKAMEEVLKERSTVLQPIDLMLCCRKYFEMLNTYYAQDIKNLKIHTEFVEQIDFVAVNANAEQLSKTVMSLLANSVYAVKKKYVQKPYDAVIRLSVDLIEGKQVCIHVYDNGIGIEETILDRIFDPFFTTKTTGEAAGVGLFLCREIVLNHHGKITVNSRKDEYTEFVIVLPLSEEDDVLDEKK